MLFLPQDFYESVPRDWNVRYNILDKCPKSTFATMKGSRQESSVYA